MSDFRKDLLARMANIYGTNHKLTVALAELLDLWEENEWNNTILKILIEAHEANPYIEEKN